MAGATLTAHATVDAARRALAVHRVLTHQAKQKKPAREKKEPSPRRKGQRRAG